MGIQLEKIIIGKYACTPKFMAALFTIARTQKQCKWPSTEEWIKKMWYIYAMEYYSTIKRDEIMPFVGTWMDLETVIQSEVSQKENDRYHILMYICGIYKKLYRLTYLQSRNRDTDIENKCKDIERVIS